MKKNQNSYMKKTKYTFSLEQLNKIGNNSEDFTLQMLKQFMLSAIEISTNMLAAVKQNDWNMVKSAAHKGVPSYSVMDLKELTDLLKAIETAAQTHKEAPFIRELVQIFNKKNQKVINEINEYFKEFEEIKVTPA